MCVCLRICFLCVAAEKQWANAKSTDKHEIERACTLPPHLSLLQPLKKYIVYCSIVLNWSVYFSSVVVEWIYSSALSLSGCCETVFMAKRQCKNLCAALKTIQPNSLQRNWGRKMYCRHTKTACGKRVLFSLLLLIRYITNVYSLRLNLHKKCLFAASLLIRCAVCGFLSQSIDYFCALLRTHSSCECFFSSLVHFRKPRNKNIIKRKIFFTYKY